MKLDHIGQSDNVEDLRGQSGGMPGGMGGGRVRIGGGGGLGIGMIVILGIVAWFMGIDPRVLIGGAEVISGGNRQVEAPAGPAPRRGMMSASSSPKCSS